MGAGEGIKAAMADLAETIRRAFQDPPCQAPEVVLRPPGTQGVQPLAAQPLTPRWDFQAEARREACLLGAELREAPMTWRPRVLGEAAWEAWSVTSAHALPLFGGGSARRMEVPPLPRSVQVQRQTPERILVRARQAWGSLGTPGVRALRPSFDRPRVHGALDRMLTLPVAVGGEDLQAISKALWMRYMLQMVRATGQNIRNLEVLGLYRIPSKGTRQVHHDPATGRLLVTLGPEALQARRAPFLLARQKDDNTVVCCFVETT